MPCYTTAKSAVQGLTRALAPRSWPNNVRVNSILPGWIMTQRQQDLWLTPEGEAELMQRQCSSASLTRTTSPASSLFAADDSGACTNRTTSSNGAGSDHSRCRSRSGGVSRGSVGGMQQSVANKCPSNRGRRGHAEIGRGGVQFLTQTFFTRCAPWPWRVLVLFDMNFPADAVARQSVLGRLLRIDTHGRPGSACDPISFCRSIPFVDKPALRWRSWISPTRFLRCRSSAARDRRSAWRPLSMGSIERFSF